MQRASPKRIWLEKPDSQSAIRMVRKRQLMRTAEAISEVLGRALQELAATNTTVAPSMLTRDPVMQGHVPARAWIHIRWGGDRFALRLRDGRLVRPHRQVPPSERRDAPASLVTTTSRIILFEPERSPRDTLDAICEEGPSEGLGFTLFPGDERAWSNNVAMKPRAVERVMIAKTSGALVNGDCVRDACSTATPQATEHAELPICMACIK